MKSPKIFLQECLCKLKGAFSCLMIYDKKFYTYAITVGCVCVCALFLSSESQKKKHEWWKKTIIKKGKI